MSPLTTVEVSAGVSAVVTASFTTIVRYGERFIEALRSRLPDDHSAIQVGALNLRVDTQTDRLALQVSSAPSRRLKRHGLEIDIATSAVESWFGSWFGDRPERSGPDLGLCYTVMREDDPNEVDRRLWLNPSGRIDLYCCLPASSQASPEPIDVADFIRPLLLLASMIKSSDYDRIYSQRRSLLKLRFDWRFVAATYIASSRRQLRTWELRFPGVAPRRAADRQAFCPSGGYASEELSGWPADRTVNSLTTVALRSVLYHNGYHDVDGAVASTLDEMSELMDARLPRLVDLPLAVNKGYWTS